MSIPVNEDEQNNEARPASSQTRRETLLLDWAADILLTRGERPSSLGREEPSPAEKIRLRRRLQEGYHSLPQGFLEEVEQLSHRVRRYRKQLFHLGIHPSEVFLTLHPASAGLFVIREMELVLVGSPLALAGTVNLLPSYLLIQIVTRAEALDRSWTNSPVSSRRLLIIAACSLAQVGAAWILLSPWWAALYSLTLPYTDYYMLLYRERTARAFRRARTFLFLLRNPQRRESLTREGREIIAQIQDLARRLKEQENDPTVRSE